MKRIILLLLLAQTLIYPIICYDKKRKMYYSSYHSPLINKYRYNYLACKVDLLMMLNDKKVSTLMIADTFYEMFLEDHTNESRLLFIDLKELANLN